MTPLIFVLIVLLLLALGLAFYLFQLNRKSNAQLERYSKIVSLEDEGNRLSKSNLSLESQNEKLKTEGRKIQEAIKSLNHQLADLEDQNALQEYGLYKPKYDLGTSEEYKSKLQEIRQEQKGMIKDEDVIIWAAEWSVGDSKAKGRAMMKQRTKMTLRAFNGECESLILKVKYNNVTQIEERIKKLRDAIHKLSKSDQSTINPDYVDSKIRELHLVHEYRDKQQEEKEEQGQIREQMREEQKAQKELEKAQAEAEKEEDRYQKALEKAKLDLEKSTGEEQAKLQAEIDKLNQALEDAHTAKERAISRAQMTKSGHVYVISNIGSFGKNVYKIGMTRRLDPLDRVKELGDASVPFLFDVHAMIYSENAPELENNLHKTFAEKRINLVNHRKEYFNVGLEDIEKIVKEQSPNSEFVLTAEAEEYRKTVALREADQSPINTESAEDAYDKLFA
jgi:hypothetical protein